MYNGAGKKTSRTTDGEITYYVYDGNTVILELDEDDSEAARNVYGRNIVSREVEDSALYFNFNGHGDVISLADELETIVVYAYDEFGNQLSETFVSASVTDVNNPYRYAGYEYLDEVKLYDLNARYYNPEIARFLSEDPYYNLGNRIIGLYEINTPNVYSIMQANNLFAYCGNNPLIFRDESGAFFGTIIGAAVGAVSGAISAAVNGDNVWVGAAVGAVTGALTGFAADAALVTGGVTAVLMVAAANAASNMIDYSVNEYANGRVVDPTAIAIEGVSGAIIGTVFYGAFGEIPVVGSGNFIKDFISEGSEKLSKATVKSVTKDASASLVEGMVNGTLSDQGVLVYEENKHR